MAAVVVVIIVAGALAGCCTNAGCGLVARIFPWVTSTCTAENALAPPKKRRHVPVDPDDGRACPPACGPLLVCVHDEAKKAGVCRPKCSATNWECQAGYYCFDVVGAAEPACVDPDSVLEFGAHVEPSLGPSDPAERN